MKHYILSILSIYQSSFLIMLIIPISGHALLTASCPSVPQSVCP